ncbi:hypothetical protein EV421DRAFT_382379 [Armillaria borealis]|uniref:Heterokaryon incompatibility domain-containing protein n=1 Tax=Armillaria borealis TaxID=47425 RepID=A0AA39IT01_9AGAR|nr:hypothetical protein EV421DRAFT_382379 [Armillaria borealis]
MSNTFHAHLKYVSLPEITLSAPTEAGQAESAIPVLKQQSYIGRKPVIPSALADTLCAELGIDGVLEKLNATLGTSYNLTASLNSVLESYIARNDDFGMAYAHLRCYWSDYATIKHILHTAEEKDQEKRQSVLVNGRIVERDIPPRRVWDLHANRVVPYWVACKYPWGISHAWVNERDRVDVWTPINRCEWPVPMPKDANLDLIRIEMLNLGAEYVWLDVLCLRQEHGLREDLRVEEWKLDVPTIGWVYSNVTVVCYFCGLGQPLCLKPDYFESDHCWFNRAWTLQEISEETMIIGGETGDGGFMTEDIIQMRFNQQLELLKQMRRGYWVFDFLSQMQKRVSTKPLDKVAGLGYLLDLEYTPIYNSAHSEEDAWAVLVDAMESTSRAQLLFFYPEPGNRTQCWRPSWEQVMMAMLPPPLGIIWMEHVVRSEKADDDLDSYHGPCINSGDVRGLSHPLHEGKGKSRQGRLFIKDGAGWAHPFRIVADHAYPIPDGSYTLIGSKGIVEQLGYSWVVGRQRQDGKFEKLSVFSMSEEEEMRLHELGVMEEVETVLC